jgi:CheY-like chemotaxis protein
MESLPASGNPWTRVQRHILLIEDSDDNRELMRDLLEMEGFRVDVASDGAQGVEQALALRPEIAIVDIGLPELDGYEVARQVRAALGGGITLVALTGYGQPSDQYRATQAGFDAHLTKPVNLSDLEAILSGTPSASKDARAVRVPSAGRGGAVP